ncbi:hypothetical protein BJX64DRAFT_250379 [Aspergillus heterothallicus]
MGSGSVLLICMLPLPQAGTELASFEGSSRFSFYDPLLFILIVSRTTTARPAISWLVRSTHGKFNFTLVSLAVTFAAWLCVQVPIFPLP